MKVLPSYYTRHFPCNGGDHHSDSSLLVDDIVRDGATKKWFTNTVLNPLLESPASSAQKQAMLQHLTKLYFDSSDFTVIMQKEWEFPDKWVNKDGWAVFTKDSRPKGLVQMSYHAPAAEGEHPRCVMKCVQGVAKSPVDLHDIDAHVIASLLPLHAAQWQIALRIDELSCKKDSFYILRQKYFHRQSVPELDGCYTTFHLLNENKKRVREIFSRESSSAHSSR